MANDLIAARLRAQMTKVVSDLRRINEEVEHLDDSIEALLARERREAGSEGLRPLADVIGDRRRPPARWRTQRAP